MRLPLPRLMRLQVEDVRRGGRSARRLLADDWRRARASEQTTIFIARATPPAGADQRGVA